MATDMHPSDELIQSSVLIDDEIRQRAALRRNGPMGETVPTLELAPSLHRSAR